VRITIFGLTLSSSWGNGHATPYRAILRALHRRGHRVKFFERDVPYYAQHRDLPNPEFCDLQLYRAWDEVRATALRDASESDIVMTASYCPEGARINDELLELASPLKVYYDLDSPVTLNRLRAGDCVDYVRGEQLGAFDLVLSWSGGNALDELRNRWGANNAQPLFGCVDPDDYRRTTTNPKYECSLSYMGTYAADRQEKLDCLFLEPSRRRSDLRFLLAGSLYPWGWNWGSNVTKTEHVPPSEHPALYSSSRCTLNITRGEMAASGYCPSGRFFEAAACATPIVSDWFDGLDHFFTPGEELFVAHSAEDVLEALDSDDGCLQTLAARARERTLDEHTGERRAQQFLDYCERARSRERKAQTRWEQPCIHEMREPA
jgi:spore maturation protein CgeB